jgi:hypothetical protein
MPTPKESLQEALYDIFTEGLNYTDSEDAKIYVSTSIADAIDTYANGSFTSPNYGGYWMQANATATTVSNTTDFFKIAGTTTADTATLGFTFSNNRATCTDPVAKWYQVNCSTSISAPNGGNIILVRIAKNGTTIASSESRDIIQQNTVSSNWQSNCRVSLVAGDYIEVWVRNFTSTQSPTASTLNLFLKSFALV